MGDNLLNEGAEDQRGENARLMTFIGAIAIGDLVKTTLGPKGMDKILSSVGRSQDITVTNDGATILKAIPLDNPSAKLLVDISRVQDDEVGDGTTSVAVLAAELLREAEKLILEHHIHPQTVIRGWRKATNAAAAALLKSAEDHRENEKLLHHDLMNIARTTLSSKILTQDKDHFAKLAVDAVLKLRGSTNLESIQILKKSGGSLNDSFLDEDGFILDKKIGVGQVKRMENCKILLANTPMDTDKIKIFGAKVTVESSGELADVEEAERAKMLQKCEKIVAHKCNVFINRQLIYNLPEQYFTSKGIISIEHADFDGVERLAKVLNAEVVSTFDHPEKVRLGECKLIEEVMIGEDKLIRFSGIPTASACTVVLRGPGSHILDEAERSLHDALCVLSQTVATDTRIVYGGGASEMLMAQAVDEVAKTTEGKESLSIEAFARALRMLPAIIADNGGYDSSDLVTKLRAQHASGNIRQGLNMTTGEVADMTELGITESFKVKNQILISASEAAEMITRVDEVVTCAPRPRQEDPRMPH